MQVSDLQHQKALFPMFVTQTGIFMLMRELQFRNVLLVDYQYYTL